MGNLLSERLSIQLSEIEKSIEAEEAALSNVIRLLKGKIPFSDWPLVLQRTLRAALTEEGEGMEAQKARWLRRHLFRSRVSLLPDLKPSDLSHEERRISERLRADLMGQVPLGAGKYLSTERHIEDEIHHTAD